MTHMSHRDLRAADLSRAIGSFVRIVREKGRLHMLAQRIEEAGTQ
jgi:hypothetical protein